MQMFGSLQKSAEQKLLKDANFLSINVCVYVDGNIGNPALLVMPRQYQKFFH